MKTSKPVRPTGEFRGLVGIITAEIYEGALWFIMLQLTCVQLPIWLWIVYDEVTCKLESRVVGLMFISTQQIHYHSRRRIWVYSCRCSFEWRSSGVGVLYQENPTQMTRKESREYLHVQITKDPWLPCTPELPLPRFPGTGEGGSNLQICFNPSNLSAHGIQNRPIPHNSA